MKAMLRSQAIAQGGDRPAGRTGGSDPVERIKDMDIDGVEAEVLHCAVGGADLGTSCDAAMHATFIHAENEARRAWCATDPQRLIPVAVLPLEDIDAAVKELEWLGREGFRAVEIPVYPDEVGLKPYFHEQWAPLWNIASDLEIPLHLHVGTNNGLSRIRQYDRTPSRTIGQSLPPIYMAECIASWILPGTFDRHPGMKVLLAESGVTWIPYYIDRLDTMMVRHRLEQLEMLQEQPSFYWRRNMACSFEEDANAKGHILEAIGVDNVLWATDYPHPDSPWPHSQEVGVQPVRRPAGRGPGQDRRRERGTAVQTGGAGGSLTAVSPVVLERCGSAPRGALPLTSRAGTPSRARARARAPIRVGWAAAWTRGAGTSGGNRWTLPWGPATVGPILLAAADVSPEQAFLAPEAGFYRGCGWSSLPRQSVVPAQAGGRRRPCPMRYPWSRFHHCPSPMR